MKLFIREKYLSKIRGFYHSEDIIKVVTGVRRCGKSSLMMMVADELRRERYQERDHRADGVALLRRTAESGRDGTSGEWQVHPVAGCYNLKGRQDFGIMEASQ